MAKTIFPNSEDSQSFRRQPVEKLLLDLFVLGHFLHMSATDDDVGHLENAVLLFHRAHYSRRHEHLGRTNLNASAHLFVAAELARVKDLDLHLALQARVHPLGVLISRDGKERPRETHVPEPERDRLRLEERLPER